SADVRRLGADPRRSGWHQVRRGVWILDDVWQLLTPEQRHAAVVHATDLSCRTPQTHLYAYESAAAVWGLPRVEPWPQHLDVLASGARPRGSRLIRIHVGDEAMSVLVNGVRVTDVARTLVDLARTGSFATALCAADHAPRHELCSRAQLLAAASDVRPRVRGRPAAVLVAELADATSMSPGESLSRAQMFLRNLPRPALQVPIDDDTGPIGVCDFGWDGVVGEFDGRCKYGVGEDMTAEEGAEVLWREKRREDRLRRRVRLAGGCGRMPRAARRWSASSANRGSDRCRGRSGSTSARGPRDSAVVQHATAAPRSGSDAGVAAVCSGGGARSPPPEHPNPIPEERPDSWGTRLAWGDPIPEEDSDPIRGVA
ncbi:MAG: hypothetical protein ACRCSN_00140, partial [Dermatophilaceae bacterium]